MIFVLFCFVFHDYIRSFLTTMECKSFGKTFSFQLFYLDIIYFEFMKQSDTENKIISYGKMIYACCKTRKKASVETVYTQPVCFISVCQSCVRWEKNSILF